jgi:nitroreductase
MPAGARRSLICDGLRRSARSTVRQPHDTEGLPQSYHGQTTDMTAQRDIDVTPAYTALERLVAERHSCRGFRPDPVDKETIRHILEIARRTPSWCNAQPWRLIITSGDATERFRQALLAQVDTGSEAAPDFPFPREYRGVYLDRRRICGFQLYERVGVARGDRAAAARQGRENFRLFGAPHVCIVTTDEGLGVYGAVDCGAFVSNFALAAQSLGVATIAQAALASQSPFLRAHFNIEPSRRVVCGISFGYEDTGHPANGFRTNRADVDEIAEWRT